MEDFQSARELRNRFINLKKGTSNMKSKTNKIISQQLKVDYTKVLDYAFNTEGVISKCYSLFHNYSFFNCLLAGYQLGINNLEPINCMSGWNKLGRKVKKGATAIGLLLPVEVRENKTKDNIDNKNTNNNKTENNKNINSSKTKNNVNNRDINNNTKTESNEEETINKLQDNIKLHFIFKKYWFTYSQTEPVNNQTEEQKQQEKEFLDSCNNDKKNLNIRFRDIERLLKKANIEKVDYHTLNGNIQGYSFENKIAISPFAENPLKTTLHEVAHIILGHTTDKLTFNTKERAIQEIEAEGVSYLVSIICGVSEDSLIKTRGYIQHYLKVLDKEETEDKKKMVYQNIIKASEQILKYLGKSK